MKSTSLFLCVFILLGTIADGQQEIDEIRTESVFRLLLLSPALEYEFPVSKKSVLAISAGIRPGTPHQNMYNPMIGGSNFHVTPFTEAQYKYFYNLEKRNYKGKNIQQNTGNFYSVRFLGRGPSIAEFSEFRLRQASFDFMISPTWGLQRTWSWLYLLFEVGPQLYWDVKGNFGISFGQFNLMYYTGILFQFKIGFNLN